MKIFTKKAFKFSNVTKERDKGKNFKTKAMAFCTAPDWVKDDLMFQWGVKDHDIEIIQTRAQELEIEVDEAKQTSTNNGGGNGKRGRKAS